MQKWTKREVTNLKKLAGNQKLSISEIAAKMGRTYHSVNSKLYDLKKEQYANSGQPWSPKEIKTVAKMLHDSNDKLCKKLNRGPKEINMMRYMLRNGKVEL